MVEPFNMGDIFFFFLGHDVDTCCKKVIVAILSLPPMTLKTFLVVLVLFVYLALVGKKLLGLLPTKYISKKSVNKLILLKVIIFFFCKSLFLERLGINLANISK